MSETTEPLAPSAGRTTTGPEPMPEPARLARPTVLRPGRRRPRPRGLPRPDRRRRLGVLELGPQRRAGHRARRRPARAGPAARGPGGDRHAAPGSSGSSSTSPSCAPAARPPPSTRPPTPTTSPSSSATPARGSSSPRTASSSRKLASQRDSIPAVEKVVLIDTTGVDLSARGDDWVITVDDLAGRGRALLDSDADAVTRATDAVRPEQPRHAHLHLGHHRPPQGRRAHPRATGVRGRRRSRRLGLLRPDELQFLWLPLAHSFGKVLLAAQLQIGFTTRRRRPRRQDRRQPRRSSSPHFMAGAPRIFEKVYARVVSMQAGRGRREGEDLQLGDRRRQAARRGQAQAAASRRSSAPSTRSPTSWSSPRSGRASAAASSTSSPGSAALSKDVGSVVRRRRPRVLEGYGLTETSAGSVRRPPRQEPRRHGRHAVPRHRGEDRRRRRDPRQGRRRHARLPQPARGDRRGADRRRLVRHRRHRRDRRRRLRAHHRPQEGPHQDLGRQVHRPRLDRGAVQGAVPAARQRASCTPTAATTPPRSSPSTPTSRPGSPRPTASPAVRPSGPKDPAVEKEVRDAMAELNAGLNRWETVKDVRILPRDLSVEEGELTPQPEDQAQGRRDEVDLSRRCPWRRCTRPPRAPAPPPTSRDLGPSCHRGLHADPGNLRAPRSTRGHRRYRCGFGHRVGPCRACRPRAILRRSTARLPASALAGLGARPFALLRARAVLRDALRLLRLQHLHRRRARPGRQPVRRTPTRPSPRCGSPAACSATSTCRWRRCSSAAARRPCCRAGDLGRILAAIRDEFGLAPGRRGDHRGQPRLRDAPSRSRSCARTASRACRFGLQSTAPHVLQVLERTHTPGRVGRGRGRGAGRRVRARQRRPHLRHARRDRGRLRGLARRGGRPRRPTTCRRTR